MTLQLLSDLEATIGRAIRFASGELTHERDSVHAELIAAKSSIGAALAPPTEPSGEANAQLNLDFDSDQ